MDKLKRVLSGNDTPSNDENSSIMSNVRIQLFASLVNVINGFIFGR